MKRRMLAAAVLVALCAALFVLPASAGYVDYDTGEYKQHFFRMEGDELYSYRGDGGDVVIPDYVKTIGDDAFTYNSSTQNVYIPEGVTAIGNGAFYFNENLLTVSIPSTVTKIGKDAFHYCQRLREVTIPEGVMVIRESCFDGCERLAKVTLPSTIAYLEDYAFYGCEKLDYVAVPEGVKLGKSVFPSTTKVEYVPKESLKQPAPTVYDPGIAYPTYQNIELYGIPVEFQTMVLYDAAGNATNYVKLRDLAHKLEGSKKEFQVEWDGGVQIYTFLSYKANGSEFQSPFEKPRAYTRSGAPTTIDFESVYLDAITLTDDVGGGHTYYKLRDLGQALGFNVGWSAARGVFVEVNKPYTTAD